MFISRENNIHIPDNLTAKFGHPETKKKLMAEYGSFNTIFAGTNEHGERILVSICPSQIVTQTLQHNGWIRENVYDAQGLCESESYQK